MLKVRFHGRGGQGAKVASRILGTAAFLEGYHAQDFPLYGAERRGAPVAAFTRISGEPILERGVIAEPDVVIVMDETLLSDRMADPLSGVKETGAVFINTSHALLEAKEKYNIPAQTVTLDITRIGLDMFGRAVLSALAGGAAAGISGLREDSLREAVEKEVSDIVADRGIIEKNINAAVQCFNSVEPVVAGSRPAPTPYKRSPVISVPFEPAAISAPSIDIPANTPLRKTGNWRLFKPVWNYDICTKCMTCVARCPDGCIAVNKDGFPYTDYENCKGCLICAEECPADAIGIEREVHAW